MGEKKQFTEDDPHVVYVRVEEAIVPPGGLIEHYKDRWWCVHPQRGLIFFKPNLTKHYLTAQCNGNEEIARGICKKLYPWAKVEYIPSVFRRIDPHDYA